MTFQRDSEKSLPHQVKCAHKIGSPSRRKNNKLNELNNGFRSAELKELRRFIVFIV